MPQRPMPLKIGVAIFILSGATTLLQAFYLAGVELELSDPVYWVMLATLALAIGLVAGIPAYAMLKGHAWGRTVILGLALLVPLTYETGLVTAADIANSTLTDKISLVAYALADFVALMLLYASAVNRWFDQAAEARRGALADGETTATGSADLQA